MTKLQFTAEDFVYITPFSSSNDIVSIANARLAEMLRENTKTYYGDLFDGASNYLIGPKYEEGDSHVFTILNIEEIKPKECEPLRQEYVSD